MSLAQKILASSLVIGGTCFAIVALLPRNSSDTPLTAIFVYSVPVDIFCTLWIIWGET